MQSLLATIQQWHLHPIIDHFTVAIFVLAVITDLVASLFSTRQWLRYSALSLIVLAALLTWGSNVTGQWAEHQVFNEVKAAGGPAFALLQRHAWIGEDILPWLISVLAIWRIGIQLLNFIARSRPFYLLILIATLALVSYEGYIGGQLVYDYGVGTAIYGAQAPAPTAVETPSGPATPMPTVYVPAATATPSASGASGESGTPEAASPSPSPGAEGTLSVPGATTTPSAGAGSSAAATPQPSAEPSPSASPSTAATAAPSV